MTPLAKYIQEQINAGYTSSQVKAFLLQQGYAQKDVDLAIKEISKQKVSSALAPVNPQLLSYVFNSLQQGYQADQLVTYLKSQGYTDNLLKPVFSQINDQYYQGKLQTTILHEHTIANSSILKIGLMFIVVALIVGGGYFFTQGFFDVSNGEKLLDVSLSPLKTNLVEGDKITFYYELTNQGSSGEVDVFLDFKIKDSFGSVEDRFEETRSFETSMQRLQEFDLDGYDFGTYTIELEASYENGKYARSSFTFEYLSAEQEVTEPEVITKPETEVEIKEPETPNSKPIETTEPEKPTPITPIVVTPMEKPKKADDAQGRSDDQLFNFALKQTDEDVALTYCVAIEDEVLNSQCYHNVAQQSSKSEICRLIGSAEGKEDCLMSFIILGDSELCAEISLPNNQFLCEQFALLNGVQISSSNIKAKPIFRENIEDVITENTTLNEFGIKEVLSDGLLKTQGNLTDEIKNNVSDSDNGVEI